ncbi:hypothetical protein AAG906_011617 [Vitis piasezkii]
MFSVCFRRRFDYDILMDTVIDVDGMTLPDACTNEMDMIGVGRILDAVPHGPHSDFDLFGVSVIDIDDPRSTLDMFGAFMLEIDDDDPCLRLILWTHLFLLTLCPVVEYPEWLANVVPIPKKDDKVRVCVDFRDLNKASPKDDFPSHTLICWLIILQGIRCYHSWMGFLGATYQRATTTLFHDMMHRDVEIRAILDMPAPRIEREIRGFLGILQYISRFIARLTDICEPIFRLLRKSQPTVWDDDCHAF